MSSLYIRQKFEGWLQDRTKMKVPYYPTINMDQNPQDDMWCTAEFGSSYRETMTFCDGVTMEEGEVKVVYFGLPGIGEATLLAKMEADLNTLMAQQDLAGKLVITTRSAPFDYSGGSAEKSFALACFVEYQYFT